MRPHQPHQQPHHRHSHRHSSFFGLFFSCQFFCDFRFLDEEKRRKSRWRQKGKSGRCDVGGAERTENRECDDLRRFQGECLYSLSLSLSSSSSAPQPSASALIQSVSRSVCLPPPKAPPHRPSVLRLRPFIARLSTKSVGGGGGRRRTLTLFDLEGEQITQMAT